MALYFERDIDKLGKDGGLYYAHVSAMTTESLHSKSDIAAELAYRDYLINTLKAQLCEMKYDLDNRIIKALAL